MNESVCAMTSARQSINRIRDVCELPLTSESENLIQSLMASLVRTYYAASQTKARSNRDYDLKRIVSRVSSGPEETMLVLMRGTHFDTQEVLQWIEALAVLQVSEIALRCSLSVNTADYHTDLYIVGPTHEIDEIQIGIGMHAAVFIDSETTNTIVASMCDATKYEDLHLDTQLRCKLAMFENKKKFGVQSFTHETARAMLRCRMWCPIISQPSSKNGYPASLGVQALAAIVASSVVVINPTAYNTFYRWAKGTIKLKATARKLRRSFVRQSFAPHGWEGTGELAPDMQNLSPNFAPFPWQLRASYDMLVDAYPKATNTRDEVFRFVCENDNDAQKLRNNLRRVPKRKNPVPKEPQLKKNKWLDSLCDGISLINKLF
jgi:hypothetical protein